MKVAVAGFFHTLRSCHFATFSQIQSLTSNSGQPLALVLLVVPCRGLLATDTEQMLRTLPNVASVHIITPSVPVNGTLLTSLGCRGVVQFDLDATLHDIDWPPVASFPTRHPQFIIKLSGPHPDFKVAAGVFEGRSSPKQFTETPVDPIIISGALQAARHSPSAGNLQAYSIILVTKKLLLAKIAVAAKNQESVSTAAGVFVFVIERERSSGKFGERGASVYAPQDTAIACSHLQLALEAFGVQSRWIGAFHDAELAEVLALRGKDVCAILAFGYSVDDQRVSARRPLDQYVTIIK
jgi:nitroreductase